MNERTPCCTVIVVLLAGVALPALGQPAAPPAPACAQAEARQFDFWLGEWDVQARSRPPGSQQWTPNTTWIRTRVRSDLSGCVLIEASIDAVGSDTLVVGLSLTSYNTHLGNYQQMWVDRQGNTWEYVGGWEDGRMVLYLEPTASDGAALVPFKKTTRIRMVFGAIEADRLLWRYEYSTDGERTWTRTHEAVYTRRR